MNTKTLIALLIMLISCGTFAQPKVFLFNEIQSRNKQQQWEKSHKIDDRAVFFYPESIELTIDKFYHLSIVSSTSLPNDGVVYLCKDEAQNDVTVTLIGGDRMFVYAKNKRFLINFKNANTAALAGVLANAEE